MEAVSDCTFVGIVSSRMGGNFQSLEHNIEIATLDVQNKAADRDATHLVLSEPVIQTMGAMGRIGGGDCNNCVLVTGRAYRCE